MTTEPYNFELLFSKTSRNKLLSNIKTINDALWDNIHNIVKINACNIPSIVSELDPRYEPAITLNTIWIERNFTPIYIYWKDLQLLALYNPCNCLHNYFVTPTKIKGFKTKKVHFNNNEPIDRPFSDYPDLAPFRSIFYTLDNTPRDEIIDAYYASSISKRPRFVSPEMINVIKETNAYNLVWDMLDLDEIASNNLNSDKFECVTISLTEDPRYRSRKYELQNTVKQIAMDEYERRLKQTSAEKEAEKIRTTYEKYVSTGII